MAASARICSGSGGVGGGIVCDRRTVIARSPPCVVPTSARRSRCLSEIGRISMSMPIANRAVKLEGRKRIGGGRDGGAVVSREKLDEWMRDSVGEIVKNLRETPLLLHVYAGENGSLTSTAATTDAVKADDWPEVKGKWERGEERTPEGVILVEKLGDDDDTDRNPTEENGRGDDVSGSSAWGILAQGRGSDCGPVCYLLKTTRVRSGLGPVCTHFCLVKVKSFRETAMSQLNNSWLIQASQ